MKTNKALNAVISFIFLFRPAILLGSMQSIYLLIPFAFMYFLAAPNRFLKISMRTFGPVFLPAVAFVLIWSLTIDLVSGELVQRHVRSMFLTSLRFFLYILIAYWLVYSIFRTVDGLRNAFVTAVVIQLVFMSAMLVSPVFKHFVIFRLSGLSERSKLASEIIDNVRGFGWSQELLYTAPAACFLVAMFLTIGASTPRFALFIGTMIFAGVNARVTLIFLLGYMRELRFLLNIITVSIFGILIIAVLVYSDDIVYKLSDYWQWWSYTLGPDGLRPLQRLKAGHFELPESGVQFFIGNGEYLFGDGGARTSDIGYLIVWNFGGLVFLIAWLCIFFTLAFSAAGSSRDAIIIVIAFLVLGVKGLVFSGNGFSAVLLTLAFARERWGRDLTPGDRASPRPIHETQ